MMSTACTDVRLGGKTVEESFSDLRFVELTLAAIRGDTDITSV